MFCTSCGSQIPGNAAFCPACGAAMPSNLGPQPTPQTSVAPPSTQPVLPHSANLPAAGTANQSKKEIAVGTIVGAVVAIAVIVVLAALKPFGTSGQTAELPASQETGTVASRGSATAPEPSDAGAPSASASASEPSPDSSPPATSTPESVPVLVDLSNPEDYYDLNIFLSNFTEWESFWENGQAYDRANYDLKQLVNWGMWHNAINNADSLKTQEVNLEGAPASEISRAITGIEPTCYPRHMQTSLIEESIRRYTGLDVDLAGYNPGDGSYFEREGDMYEGYYRGAANALDHVALATSVESAGGNDVRVDFTVYSGYNEFRATADKSWYGLDGGSLEAAMRAHGSSNVWTRSGSATVEVVGTGSDRSFRLVTFEVADER